MNSNFDYNYNNYSSGDNSGYGQQGGVDNFGFGAPGGGGAPSSNSNEEEFVMFAPPGSSPVAANSNLDFYNAAPSYPPATGAVPKHGAAAPAGGYGSSSGFQQPQQNVNSFQMGSNPQAPMQQPGPSFGSYNQPSYQETPGFNAFTAAPAPNDFSDSIGGGDSSSYGSNSVFNDDDEDELPLLEELGINFADIWEKTKAVLHPLKPVGNHLLDDIDLAGPLVYCLLLGTCLLLTGKVHFGYIYGFGLVGCVMMSTILNLMSEGGIDLHKTMCILGYCLLPIVFLAALSVVFDLRGMVGMGITGLSVLWCTTTATQFIEAALNMRSQRYLVAYPCALLFSCFALITVF